LNSLSWFGSTSRMILVIISHSQTSLVDFVGVWDVSSSNAEHNWTEFTVVRVIVFCAEFLAGISDNENIMLLDRYVLCKG
jgi:hypothetical protein